MGDKMSCFQVSGNHISAIVGTVARFIRHSDELLLTDRIKAQAELGRKLAQANLESVNERYAESDGAPVEISEDRILHYYKNPLTAIEVIKLIDCLRYQSCEAKSWDNSESDKFLRDTLRRLIYSLPGYDDAQWCI